MNQPLPDIQNTADKRGVHLEQVGVSDLRYPITVLDQLNGKQQTIATVRIGCL
jgi:GTP cyclohydrolase I